MMMVVVVVIFYANVRLKNGGKPAYARSIYKMKKRPERRKHSALVMQAGYILHLCTKFEADYSIRSKVIKGSQN